MRKWQKATLVGYLSALDGVADKWVLGSQVYVILGLRNGGDSVSEGELVQRIS